MISLESYSGLSLKKLMLVIFYLLEYIYFLYYHPVDLEIINNMSEILHAMQQNKYLILNKEKQLYKLHQELLTNYKGFWLGTITPYLYCI